MEEMNIILWFLCLSKYGSNSFVEQIKTIFAKCFWICWISEHHEICTIFPHIVQNWNYYDFITCRTVMFRIFCVCVCVLIHWWMMTTKHWWNECYSLETWIPKRLDVFSFNRMFSCWSNNVFFELTSCFVEIYKIILPLLQIANTYIEFRGWVCVCLSMLSVWERGGSKWMAWNCGSYFLIFFCINPIVLLQIQK